MKIAGIAIGIMLIVVLALMAYHGHKNLFVEQRLDSRVTNATKAVEAMQILVLDPKTSWCDTYFADMMKHSYFKKGDVSSITFSDDSQVSGLMLKDANESQATFISISGNRQKEFFEIKLDLTKPAIIKSVKPLLIGHAPDGAGPPQHNSVLKSR